MSDTKNMPAFPVPKDMALLIGTQNAYGVSIRDYFAAKAMQAYSSDPDWRVDMSPEETAYAAYQMADAMLKAREQ
jgi:hypothetical protein